MPESPPRVRGWSHAAHDLVGRDGVSPARAGMVPSPRRPSPRERSLPRACGDGPAAGAGDVLCHAAPPGGRGWSRAVRGQVRPRPVSPARAGMVPRDCRTNSAPPRLPRACGDGPCIFSPLQFFGASPPRVRGWSRLDHEIALVAPVSPARAGMVPRWSPLPCAGRGLPRACGDGPSTDLHTDGAWLSPPRVRGWSPVHREDVQRLQVSPARAGMVPCPSTASTTTSSLPRACGDGPLWQTLYGGGLWSPPRVRGWSAAPFTITKGAAVSPARAGMVPSRCARVPCCGRPPRACGDGPAATTCALLSTWSPPRVRGWSATVAARPAHRPVSPARAGMVPCGAT